MTNNLNAMHEVELSLKTWKGIAHEDEYGRFCGWLEHITGGSLTGDSTAVSKVLSSTARQRAEAYLRTMGKWKE